MTALLDTHVLIWWLQGDGPLSPAQRRTLGAADGNSPLRVSDISLWEIATLHGLGRIQLTLPLREWLEKAAAPPLVRRHGISPAIAAEVAAPPDSFHRHPADRILVATARILGATLLTHDRHILDSGLVEPFTGPNGAAPTGWTTLPPPLPPSPPGPRTARRSA